MNEVKEESKKSLPFFGEIEDQYDLLFSLNEQFGKYAPERIVDLISTELGALSKLEIYRLAQFVILREGLDCQHKLMNPLMEGKERDFNAGRAFQAFSDVFALENLLAEIFASKTGTGRGNRTPRKQESVNQGG